jgi:hypothetical protein
MGEALDQATKTRFERPILERLYYQGLAKLCDVASLLCAWLIRSLLVV